MMKIPTPTINTSVQIMMGMAVMIVDWAIIILQMMGQTMTPMAYVI
jgi:hypothetical protein